MPLLQFAIFTLVLIALYLLAEKLQKPRKRIHDTTLEAPVDERESV